MKSEAHKKIKKGLTLQHNFQSIQNFIDAVRIQRQEKGERERNKNIRANCSQYLMMIHHFKATRYVSLWIIKITIDYIGTE